MSKDFDRDEPRPGEILGTLPDRFDAGLHFIGRIRTPYGTRADCPHQASPEGPECRIELFEPYRAGLLGLDRHAQIQVLYFMHQARRDVLVQHKRGAAQVAGTFALRSPVRPNPIAVSVVRLERIEAGTLVVRALDCVDGTPLIDLKPWRGVGR